MEMIVVVPGILLFAVLCLFTVVTGYYRRGRKTAGGSVREYPFISLLKPIKGVEDGLAGNLESFFRLDYPAYEVLFAVDGPDDPSLPLLRSVIAAHPETPAKIIPTDRPAFENPKIHKLARLEAESRGRLYWVTDANVRTAPDTLRRLVDEYLSHGAKIVFSPIRGSGSRTFGSLMENAGLNFFTSGSVLSAWLLGRHPVIVGKSILIERAALETFGGFAYFKDVLAEDYLLGEAFKKGGFRVSTGFTWIDCHNPAASPASFLKRMSRWAKLRYHLRPGAYLLEILLNPLALMPAAWAALGFRGLIFPAAAVGAKVVLEYVNFLLVNPEDGRSLRNHLRFPAAVIAKDLILLAVYFVPFFSRRVAWRGGPVAIGRKTLIDSPANRDRLAYEGA